MAKAIRMKRSVLFVILLLLFLSLPAAAVSFLQEIPQSGETRLETNDGDVVVSISRTAETTGVREVRSYTYENGDCFTSSRFQSAGAGALILETVFLPGNNGTLRWFDEEGNLHQETLQTGVYSAGMYFLETDAEQMIVSLPRCYVDQENDSIQSVSASDGTMSITPCEGGYRIRLLAPGAPEDGWYTWYLLQGGEIDWTRPEAAEQWGTYQMEGDNRWTYRGYYYTSPDNYIPTGEGYYHRIPVSYIPIKMLDCPDEAARELALPMLHVMLELQCPDGYFPTLAGSEWLLGDYEIDAGFYDTRFSTDMAAGLLTAWEQYGVEQFWQAAKAYGNFLVQYVQENHRVYTAPNGESGWLVEDYHSPNGNLPVHTSLNHQLCEILFLYRMERATGDTLYGQAADEMRAGITAVGTDWLQPDGNLWYAIYPDDTLGGVEYPYLTYNDLYDLQEMLMICRGQRDPVLQTLMDSKLQWMQENGIEGYRGQ
jgi:hypothetical protein